MTPGKSVEKDPPLVEPGLRDHWHLSVDGGPEQCGSFSFLAQHAVNAMWKPLSSVEQACAGLPSRTHQRCDTCHPCRVYDRLEGALHWLRKLGEEFYTNRVSFEIRRADLNFDEVLPCGTRLRVTLRDVQTSCPRYDELDLR